MHQDNPSVAPACYSDEQKWRHDLAKVERHLRVEFRRFDLTLRQLILAETLLDISYGWGQKSVKVPRLEDFVGLTGITVGNVHANLEALHNMRIINVEVKDGVAEYSFNPYSDKWQCKPRISSMKRRHTIEMLKPYNNQSERVPSDVARTIEHVELGPRAAKAAKSATPTNGSGRTVENFKDGSAADSLVAGFPDLGNLSDHQEHPTLPNLWV
jgi:hypothetical protein